MQLLTIARDGSSSLCEDLVGSIPILGGDCPQGTRSRVPCPVLALGFQLVLEVGDVRVGQRRLSVFRLGSSSVCDGSLELAGQSGLEGQLVQVFQTSALLGI